MPREEDFSDIPELGPADDERSMRDIPTLQTSQAVKKPAKTAAPKPAKGSSGKFWLLFILVLLLAGFGGYQFFNMQQQLKVAESALLQTQSRLADLESLVSATDESTSKTGAVLLAQLKRQQQDREARINHVDSEIRKLWAVYQKYKPVIEDLQAQDKKQGQQLASQQKELKTVGGSLDSLGVAMDKQSDSVKKLQSGLDQSGKQLADVQKKTDTQLASLKEQLRNQDLNNQEVDDLQSAQLRELKAKVAQGADTKALQAKVDDQQRAIESINANRRQVNAELLRLRDQLGKLQTSTP